MVLSTSTADAVAQGPVRRTKADPDAPLGTIKAVRARRAAHDSSFRSGMDVRGESLGERVPEYEFRESDDEAGVEKPMVNWSALDDDDANGGRSMLDSLSQHAVSPHGAYAAKIRPRPENIFSESTSSKTDPPPTVTVPVVTPAPLQSQEEPAAQSEQPPSGDAHSPEILSGWFGCGGNPSPPADGRSESQDKEATLPPVQTREVTSTESSQRPGVWDMIIAAIDPTQNPTSPKAGDPGGAVGEEDSVGDGNLLGDLKSLPSVNGDSTTAGQESLGLDDDPMSSPADVASVVANKVHNMNEEISPPQFDTSDIGSTKLASPGAQSMEARRHLLIRELRSAIATYGRYDIRCANISAALGDLLDELKEYEQALKLHTDAVTIYTCKLGDDNTSTMNAKLRLGAVFENAGQYDEAIKTFYLVTAMRRTLRGESHPSVADGLLCMAHTLRKKGDFQQAIKELKRALKIYRESLGDANDKVSSTVDEIANLYVTIGDFEKSAAILEEVVKLKAVTRGTSSNEVASTLCSLATTYECAEDFPKALKTLKKAYKIYTEIDGYSSQDATTTLNRIAQLYEATSDYNRASIAYLGVLRGRKINFGTENLQVGETYYRLGHTLRATGQLEKALKCMKEALPIFVGKGVELADVEMIAEIMHEMACINKDKRHFHDAARIFKQELSVRRKIGQPEFPQVARTLNLLGEAEFEIKNHSRALKYLVEALTIYQDEGEQDVDCAEVLFNTGRVFEAVRNKERALEAYNEAIRIFQEHGYGVRHHRVLKAQERVDRLRAGRRDDVSTSSSKRRLFK